MPTKAEAFKLFPLFFLSEFVSYAFCGELYLSLLWKNLSSNLLLLTMSALDQFNLCAAAIIHPLLKKSSLIISHLQVSASTPHFILEHRREMNYIHTPAKFVESNCIRAQLGERGEINQGVGKV